MANTTLFNTRAAAMPAADTRNEAGGKAYAFSAKHALAQYAVTGCLNLNSGMKVRDKALQT